MITNVTLPMAFGSTGTSVLVAVGSGVLVRVLVGGTGVLVGGTGVLVGGGLLLLLLLHLQEVSRADIHVDKLRSIG